MPPNAHLDTPHVYLDGRCLPKHEATFSIEERAALFADGVYEVVRYYHGNPFAMQPHLDRLRRSMQAIDLPEPDAVADLPAISDQLIDRNAHHNGQVYWQISRGPAPRNHVYPDEPAPTVLVMTYPAPPLDANASCPTCRAALTEDRRWVDCWIKSLMLLPNSMARTAARRAGQDEAIFHRNNHITEGASTNAFLVKDGALYTHPADGRILAGITRSILLDIAQHENIPVHEHAFTTDDIPRADELFICGTTTHVTAVTHVDGQPIATGQPGAVTERLHRALLRRILEQCGEPAQR